MILGHFERLKASVCSVLFPSYSRQLGRCGSPPRGSRSGRHVLQRPTRSLRRRPFRVSQVMRREVSGGNSGGRFSAKAARPILYSSEERVARMAAVSYRSPCSIETAAIRATLSSEDYKIG